MTSETMTDEDFDKFWNSNIDDVSLLKNYITRQVKSYRDGIEKEIEVFILEGIERTKSEYFSEMFDDNVDYIKDKIMDREYNLKD